MKKYNIIVAHARKTLFSLPVELDLNKLPHWKPRIRIDSRLLDADNEE